MDSKFKVGNTYIAKGFSNYGSVIRVKVLGRSEATVRIGCDILFKESARKKIAIDEEGNEFLNLGRGFVVNAADVDKKMSAVHEAQMLQDVILRDDIRARAYVESLVEDVIDGMDDVHLRQGATQLDVADEEWEEEEITDRYSRWFVSNIEWNREPLVLVPQKLQISLPDGVIDTEQEPSFVTDAVIFELKRLGIAHGTDLIGCEVVSYTLTETMTYDFDESDLDIGLSSVGELSPVNALGSKYADSFFGRD